MTIHRSGYDTTVGVGMVTKQIEHAIKEAFIKDMIYNRHLDLITSLDYKPVFVTGAYSSESNIPFFAHPLLIEQYKGSNYICADVRPFIRSGDQGSDLSVKNQTEFNFAMNRMMLNMAWVSGEVNQIKLNLSFAGVVFAAWLSETISKRFALDPKDQMVLAIITHYFYQSLFYSEDRIEEELLQKFAVHTIKATRASSQLVFEVFDKIKTMNGLDDYCTNVKDILENIRLKDLNKGLIITMIGNTWYSLNSQEILAVALEHPPTWAAIVYASLMERTYRNSLVARIAERYAKNGAGKEFLDNFAGLVKSLTAEKEMANGPVFRAFD